MESDIYEIISGCKAELNNDKFQQAWKHQIDTKHSYSLFRLLWNYFGNTFLILSLVEFIWKISSSIYEPEATGKLVSYFNPKTTLTFNDAIFYSCILIGIKLGHAVILRNYNVYVQQLAFNINNGVCSLVYRKVLQLSPAAVNDIGLGNIITIMAKDIKVFEKSIDFFLHFAGEVVQGILVCYLIYRKMGLASFVGIGLLIAIFPVQLYFSKLTKDFRLALNQKTDERLQATQETLSAIKIIKMYTWERAFVGKILDRRQKEMKYILKVLYLRCLVYILGLFTSRFVLYLLMVTYIATTPTVSAEVIFYVMQAYSRLRHSLAIVIPMGFGKAAELIASYRRISRVLQADELDRDGEFKIKEPRVKVAGATVRIKDRVILKNITTEIRPGLTVVTGPLGCGKTSLLKLFLNDFPISEGKLVSQAKFSYCSQDYWLFPSSIKQNIIFGEPYDELRYQQVVKACALDYDFSVFENGDETIVADGGHNLSGGQQSRINLARAVYKDSDIYLLDDPLHSLDPDVQAHIYQHCIKGVLGNYHCVLVTHNLSHKDGADHLIVLNEGQIKFDGKITELKEEVLKDIQLDVIQSKETNDEEDVNEESGLIKTVNKKQVYSESKKEGKVDFEIVKTYIRFGGGFLLFFCLMLFLLITECGESYSSRVFTNWINLQQNISNLEIDGNITNSSTYVTLQDKAEFTINVYSGILVSTFLMDLCVYLLVMNFSRKASVGLHNAMITKLSTATMTFFDNHFIGNILNRFSQDLAIVDEVLPVDLTFLAMMVFSCFAAIMVVSSVSYIFLIPSVMLVAILYSVRIIYMRTARSLKRLEAATRSPIIGHLNASVEGVTTIRASKMELLLAQEFDRHQDLNTSAGYMMFCVRQAFGFFIDLWSAIYVTSVIGILLFWFDGQMSGDAGLALTRSGMLATIVQFALVQWSETENDMTHIERVVEYTEVAQVNNHHLNQFNSGEFSYDNYEGLILQSWPKVGAISFKNVNLTYKFEKVLNDITIEIAPKSKIGIVGRTGAGKSSIISVLFRLYTYNGLITIDGVNIKTLALEYLRQNISIIPQNPLMFQGTLRENLDPLEIYTEKELWLSLDKVKLTEFVGPLGLDMDVDEHGSNFSAGQRQLVCLARAILKKNKIILLDEATANMDPNTDALVQHVIAENFSDCTILIIAHRLQSVFDCNKILVMDRGRVVEYDDPILLREKKTSHFCRLLSSDDSFK